jgi:exodeoxyribonuclease VII small subunit
MPKQDNKSITDQLAAFERLVAWFDTDDFSLEEALTKFEQAQKLAHDIESKLASVKNDVKVLKTKFTDANV